MIVDGLLSQRSHLFGQLHCQFARLPSHCGGCEGVGSSTAAASQGSSEWNHKSEHKRASSLCCSSAAVVEEVEAEEVDCSTSTDGQALVGLLQQCENWVVRNLRLTGTVDKHFWKGLASAIPIGPIPQYWWDDASVLQMIRMNRKVMARGRRDHLRKVWRFTGGVGGYWWVYGNSEPIRRRNNFGHGVEREEEGWKEIELELEKEVTV